MDESLSSGSRVLYRKAENTIREFLRQETDKVLVVSGARQVGKSFLIRRGGKELFKNFVEINLVEDFSGGKNFKDIHTKEDFYLILSAIVGDKLGNSKDTLIFLDEIQQYPELLTLLKFLREDNRFRYIASGSLLGISLKKSASIPFGSIQILQMYPLDIEEFFIACNVGREVRDHLFSCFQKHTSPKENIHRICMDLFRKYLIVGGMPEAVKTYLDTYNVVKLRRVQDDIKNLYGLNAEKYDALHQLKIKRIYNMIPSNLENKKKRLVFNQIENKPARGDQYFEEIDYLVSAGIAIEVKAVSNPVFPLVQSSRKNLVKLYLNDVGILTSVLYRNNVKAILSDENSVNLGSVYENAVAMELSSLGHRLFYYDNRQKGEIDFLIDNYSGLSVLPIEVKSGKDYKRHNAISSFVKNKKGDVRGIVLSNSGTIESKDGLLYLPVYMCMFLKLDGGKEDGNYI